MKRILTALLAAFALWAAAPSASQAQGTHGCACLFNRVGQAVQFQYKWGNQPFQTRTLLPGHVYSFCWPYGVGAHSSPPLHFMLDRDMSPGASFTDYALPRVQSNTTQCSGVPSTGHYHVAFQPGTNNQFVHVVRGSGIASAPPMPGPGPGPMPGPGPGPGMGQAQFGCACVNNGAGAPITYQFRWGAHQQFQVRTLPAGMTSAFCWNYQGGAHTSPNLEFMLNRTVGGGPPTFTDYNLPRVQSPTNQCSGVPRAGQYWVRFQPGTNNQFLHVTR